VRQGVREFLEQDGDLTLVAEAADRREAARLASEHQPDVAVLDVRMPGVNGIEAKRQIKAAYPNVRVLILTAYDDDPYIFVLLRAGADGYVLKTTDPDDLVRAVKLVAAGDKVPAPAIAAKVVAQMSPGRPAADAERAGPLTERELGILRLTAQGLSNRAIAATLALAVTARCRATRLISTLNSARPPAPKRS
jgi:DNA-binding NarL/FixJ family response regulator